MKKLLAVAIAALFVLSAAACGAPAASSAAPSSAPAASPAPSASSEAPKENVTLTVAASPAPHAEILGFVKGILAKEGITLEIREYTDYVMPNNAVFNKEVDANYFQHQPYLTDFNAENKTDLVSVAAVHFEPLGIYPGRLPTLADLKEGSSIVVPNDTTNEARALNLLAAQGLIKLKADAGLKATVKDIVENPKKLKIVEVEAAQVALSLPDYDLGVVNGNYAVSAGITAKVLVTEDPKSEAAQTFANILAVRPDSKDSAPVKALVKALTSEETRKFISDKYGVAVVPVF